MALNPQYMQAIPETVNSNTQTSSGDRELPHSPPQRLPRGTPSPAAGKKSLTKISRRLLREVDETRAFAAQAQIPWLSVCYDASSRQAVATFQGPPDSLYAEGVFRVTVSFRPDHPTVPPRVKFTHQVFHPNVSLDGQTIDSQVLASLWSPSMSLLTLLCHVRDLLSFTDLTPSRDCTLPPARVGTVDSGSRGGGVTSGVHVGTECAGLWRQSPSLARDVTLTHTAANANHSLYFY